MRRYTLGHRPDAEDGKPFWMPWGLGRWGGKALLFLLALLLFILLFTLPRCSNNFRPQPWNPGSRTDTTIVTPNGDTLRGNEPRLFNPRNRRGELPRDEPPGSDRRVDWPKGVPEDGRNPALPDPDDNIIPPTDPEEIVTDPRTGRGIDSSHLLVVLNSDAGDETYNRFAEELSALYSQDVCSIVYYNTLTKLIVLQVQAEQRETVKTALPSQITDIDFYVCDIEVIGENSRYPDDPAFQYPSLAWHYDPIQAPEAWEITQGSPNVVVAVVDSYFELNHPDLKDVRVVSPISIQNGTENVYPRAGANEASLIHGTHVAGIIFGTMGNREGASGIAPKCSFMPVSLGETLNTVSQIEGILYAVYKGASVINVSIGLMIDERIANQLSLETQIEYARLANIQQEQLWHYVFKLCDERNVTIVWSAGNSNLLSLMDESKRDSTTVKVEAVGRDLQKASFSNFGTVPAYGVDGSTIAAPGVDILSTIPYGDYMQLQGTSMAAPIVTGAVALIKSVDPTLTNAEIIEILKTTAKPIDDPSIGDLLQIRSALDKVREDFMRFDDVMQDHNLLLGRWKSTRELQVINRQSDGTIVHTNETCNAFFTFAQTSSGVHEVVLVSGSREGEVCSSNVSVKFLTDEIVFKDRSAPMSSQGSRFIAQTFHCRPDSLGLLSVVASSDGAYDDVHFYLRKVE